MCVHKFSKNYFYKYANKVLKPDYYRSFFVEGGLRQMRIKQDPIDPTSSFKANKINFMDVAHLFGALERRYHLITFFSIGAIDSIDDAYNVFTDGIAKMRQYYVNQHTADNKTNKGTTMTQPEISYGKIYEAAAEYLVNDLELNLNQKDIYPNARLSKDLRMDDAAKIQAIKYVEEKLNLEQIDEDRILNRKLQTLQQFCLALYFLVNGKEEPAEQPTLLQRIKQRFTRQRS